MLSSEPISPDVSPDENMLREKAAQLVRDNVDLATRWYFLADWPSDFAPDLAAAAWDMEVTPELVQNDLCELMRRGLIHFDQASARYRLSEAMKRVATGLFGEQKA